MLADRGELVGVDVFDRIFDGEDVVGLLFVDGVDD